jgi:8-oxo-dGTP pyrophosphatase MutT (NUDIX family)
MKTLFKGNYFNVVAPSPGDEIIQEKRHVFALLVIEDHRTLSALNLVVRLELVPAYGIRDATIPISYPRYATILSGSIEPGETDEQAVLREIKEEAGVVSPPDMIECLETDIPIMKSTSLRSSIYVVYYRSYNLELSRIKGDGSLIEKRSDTVTVPINDMSRFLEETPHDFLILGGYHLLMNWLRVNNLQTF